jgi:hypothetical protein
MFSVPHCQPSPFVAHNSMIQVFFVAVVEYLLSVPVVQIHQVVEVGIESQPSFAEH